MHRILLISWYKFGWMMSGEKADLHIHEITRGNYLEPVLSASGGYSPEEQNEHLAIAIRSSSLSIPFYVIG